MIRVRPFAAGRAAILPFITGLQDYDAAFDKAAVDLRVISYGELGPTAPHEVSATPAATSAVAIFLSSRSYKPKLGTLRTAGPSA